MKEIYDAKKFTLARKSLNGESLRLGHTHVMYAESLGWQSRVSAVCARSSSSKNALTSLRARSQTFLQSTMPASGKQVHLSEKQVRSVFRNVVDRESPCELVYKVIPMETESFKAVPKCVLEGRLQNVSGHSIFVFLLHLIWCVTTEGIYILCDITRNGFPRHLKAHFMKEIPTEPCEWAPHKERKGTSTNLKMKYFYPKSTDKCGDLWIMVRRVQLHHAQFVMSLN